MANKSKLPSTSLLPSISEQQAVLTPLVGQAIREATRARPGQPTKRTPEIVQEVLDRISCGESLLSVCQDEHMPGMSTFKRWKREDAQLAEWMRQAYEELAETFDDIADDMLAGGRLSTGEFRRDEARVGHLRWRLGKLNKAFRDKVQVDMVQHQVFVMPDDIVDGEGF